MPLLNKVVLLPKQEDGDELYADDEQARLEGPSPILVAARQVSGFHFQWIPPYRLYAMGEEFWHVLELKDSRWGPQEDEELEEVGKKKGRESKL